MKDSRNENSVTPPGIQLIAIGSELLNGEIRETNLHWLIKFFTRKGGRIVRCSVIPDDFASVDAELMTAKKSGVDLVVTTGGLGPTDDDATMAAIAECINSPLINSDIALEMVKKRLDSLAGYRPGIPRELTTERKSMACMPENGEPLWNPVGVAPGMKTNVGGMYLVVLPGVPSEMKGIIKDTLKDFWKELFKGVCFCRRNIVFKGIPESELGVFTRKVGELDPGVYIKTRLKLSGRPSGDEIMTSPEKLKWRIIVHLSVIDKSTKSGNHRLDALVDELVKELRLGYKYPLDINLFPDRV